MPVSALPARGRVCSRWPGGQPVFRLVFGLALLLLAPAARAQTAPGQCLRPFDATTNQVITTGYVCVGQPVYFRNCGPPVPAGRLAYDLDSRDGLAQAGNDSAVTYTTAGRLRVTQIINVVGGSGQDTLTLPLTVYPVAQPQAAITTCLRSIQVALTDPTYPTYTVRFNNGPPLSFAQGDTAYAPLLAGTGAGSIRVTITGSNGGRCPSAPLDLTVPLTALPTQVPRILALDILTPTANRQISFAFSQLATGFGYALERDTVRGTTPGWTTVATLTATATTQSFVLARAAVRQAHRYRLRLLNGACGRRAPQPAVLLSNEAGAVPVVALAPGNSSFTLRWAAYPTGTSPPVRGWEVYRNGQRIRSLPATARAFEDVTVACQRRYCYEVAAVVPLTNPLDTLRARSSDSCGVAVSTRPPAAARVRASFDLANNLLLTALVPPAETAATFDFRELPASGAGAGTSVGTAAMVQLLAPDTALVRTRCYAVQFADSCGNPAPMGPRTCPVVLRVRRTADRRTALLTWTAYTGFAPEAVAYRVLLLDDLAPGIVLRDTPVGTATTFADDLTLNDRQVRLYRIVAEVAAAPGDTARAAYSNTVALTDEAALRFPTAFTPNGDLLNDTFGPVGRFTLRQVVFQIYDRWGREIFATTTPGQAWDGTAHGTAVPPGVFVWRFRGTDATGRTFDQRGTVTVLR